MEAAESLSFSLYYKYFSLQNYKTGLDFKGSNSKQEAKGTSPPHSLCCGKGHTVLAVRQPAGH